MRLGISSPNYKNGKYILGVFNKRDFFILVMCIVISLFFAIFVLPYTDYTFEGLSVLSTICVCVFVIIMPIPHYQAFYVWVYYQFKHITQINRYLWSGIEYDFKVNKDDD